MDDGQKRCECGKVCYTKKEAQSVVNYVRNRSNKYRRGGSNIHSKPRRDKIPIRVYYCEFCNYWHTTSHVSRYELRNKTHDN